MNDKLDRLAEEMASMRPRSLPATLIDRIESDLLASAPPSRARMMPNRSSAVRTSTRDAPSACVSHARQTSGRKPCPIPLASDSTLSPQLP